MRIQLILLLLIMSVAGYSQIVDGITYTEDEIAIQDKFVEAKKYTLIGRFEKAEEILKKLYNDDRKNAAIAMELSKIYGYMEDPYNEFRFSKTAYENDTGNEYVKVNYANVCVDQEKFDEAIPPLKLLVANNKSSEAYSDQLATAYLQTNNSDAALLVYNNLEKEIGVTENVSRRKYEIYQILGKKSKALSELQNLSAAFPNEIGYMQNVASYYIELGKEDMALEVYKKILEIDINDATANMAIAAASTGDGNDNNYLRSLTPIIENKSIPVDRKVLELVPYIDQLNTSYDQELADALIMLADRITIIHPKEAKSHALNGDVLMASDRPKDAAKAYEKTLTINDNVYPVWEGLMESYTDTKDYANLLRVATEALDLFPNKASAYMYYGRANTFTKNYTEAIDLLEEGVFVSGKDVYHKSNILAELARAQAANNKFVEAEENIQKALKMSDNKNGLALEIFGDILFQKGDTSGALKQWKNAQKVGIKSSNLAEKIELKNFDFLRARSKHHIGLREFIFIATLAIVAIGCGSNKVITYSGPTPDRSNTELISALENHNYSFDWYACETGIQLDTPDEGVSGKAYIRMRRDSIIWSVVKKYSVEGARTLITENTFAAVNRMDHTYQKGSTSEALSKMGISLDFLDLQEAIFGNIILLDTSSAMTIEKEGQHYIIKGIDQDLQLKYWVNGFSLDLDRAIMIDHRGRKIEVNYRDYRTLDSGQKLPFYRHYIVPYDERGDAEVILKVKKIEIDVPKKTRFSIPPHYEKV